MYLSLDKWKQLFSMIAIFFLFPPHMQKNTRGSTSDEILRVKPGLDV